MTWFAKSAWGGRPLGGRWLSPEQRDRSIAWCAENGYNLYVGLNGTTYGGIRARRKHIAEWRYVLIDYDKPVCRKVAYEVTCDMRSLVELALGVRVAGIGIWTGRGAQLWVTVRGGVPDIQAEQGTAVLLRKVVTMMPGIDTCTYDLPRVARCPGSKHQSTARWAEQVNTFGPAHDGLTSEVIRALATEYVTNAPAEQPSPPSGSPLVDIYPVLSETAKLWLARGGERGGRHHAAFATAKSLQKDAGVGREDALSFMCVADRKSEQPLGQHEIEYIVRCAYRGEEAK
jgi:hypothetical protein